jgi:hypothetical protein
MEHLIVSIMDGLKLASASDKTAINMPVMYVIDSSKFWFYVHSIMQSMLLSNWAANAQFFIKAMAAREQKRLIATHTTGASVQRSTSPESVNHTIN